MWIFVLAIISLAIGWIFKIEFLVVISLAPFIGALAGIYKVWHEVNDIPIDISTGAVKILGNAVEQDQRQIYLNNISGLEFEDEILDLFHRSGYNANKTRQNYPGIDIIARMIDKSTGEVTERIVIQCKRFSDLVDKTKVEQFYYRCLKEPPETKKYMFASSGFSVPAWDFARNHDIKLFDGETISKFI